MTTPTVSNDQGFGQDDTAPAGDTAPPPATSTDQPTAPPAAPPGDFTTGPLLSSPSFWLTVATYLLAVLGAVLHRDLSGATQAVATAGPVLASLVLMAARNLHKREVIRANAALAQHRLALQAAADQHAAALAADERKELIARLTPAKAAEMLQGDTVIAQRRRATLGK